jgi:hypothetical protein
MECPDDPQDGSKEPDIDSRVSDRSHNTGKAFQSDCLDRDLAIHRVGYLCFKAAMEPQSGKDHPGKRSIRCPADFLGHFNIAATQ